MSAYQFDYIPQYFKDKLKWDEQIKDQQAQVRKALNYGTLSDIANTVKTLELMITKGIIPKEDSVEKDLDELNDDLEEHFQGKMDKYEDLKKTSRAPGSLLKPSRRLAPRWYYEAKFNLLCNFFDRLGLGFQHDSEGHF